MAARSKWYHGRRYHPIAGDRRGNKLATQAIAKGEIVVRYGQSIGQATEDIPAGGHIHSHNLGMGSHSTEKHNPDRIQE